jgi:hypothetical protein
MNEAQPVARRRRKLIIWGSLIGVVIAFGAWFTWTKFFREEPQPDWSSASADMRFKYGSIGAEWDAGVPYWIFYVLPRVFPEKLPGPGGFASLGAAWEQGQELPGRNRRSPTGGWAKGMPLNCRTPGPGTPRTRPRSVATIRAFDGVSLAGRLPAGTVAVTKKKPLPSFRQDRNVVVMDAPAADRP